MRDEWTTERAFLHFAKRKWWELEILPMCSFLSGFDVLPFKCFLSWLCTKRICVDFKIFFKVVSHKFFWGLLSFKILRLILTGFSWMSFVVRGSENYGKRVGRSGFNSFSFLEKLHVSNFKQLRNFPLMVQKTLKYCN